MTQGRPFGKQQPVEKDRSPIKCWDWLPLTPPWTRHGRREPRFEVLPSGRRISGDVAAVADVAAEDAHGPVVARRPVSRDHGGDAVVRVGDPAFRVPDLHPAIRPFAISPSP